MPAHSLKLYAKWELGKKSYRVNHYIQEVRLGENYELAESENFIGTAGEMVAPEVKTYEGFTSPEKQYYDFRYRMIWKCSIITISVTATM